MDRSPPAPLIVISGAAGTGKTTLSRAWSSRTGAVIVDLDDETSDIVRQVMNAHPRWSERQAVAESRDTRYERLVDVISRERGREAVSVIAVAPFTREIHSESRWREFVHGCGGGDVALIWLWLHPGLRSERISHRGERRDIGRRDAADSLEAPAVEHLAIDSSLPTEDQVGVLRSHFSNGPFM